jgi:hypothetical protein
MIVYQLACPDGHFFEGWFASAEACERQTAEGRLQCPTCASSEVRKLPSAPHVHTSPAAAPSSAEREAVVRQEAIAALRSLIVSGMENVGKRFAEVARRMHYKEEKARAIRGEATIQEAVELADEGIEAYVVPPEINLSGEVH